MDPIIDDQHVDLGQPSQPMAEAAVGAGQGQVAKQSGGADEKSAETVPASLLAQGAGQPAFPDAGRP